jgi:putative ABC transport system permease protein
MHGLKKLQRDFVASWGRSLLLIFALAVGATALLATLGAYGTLMRDMKLAYVETVPASATLELSEVTDELLHRVRQRPEIAAATRRRTLHGRFQATPGGPWKHALIFVADSFEAMPLAKLGYERGAVNPKPGTVLIERSAVSVLGGDLGTHFALKLPGGPTLDVAVSGVVHEPALAPANTHESIYLYALPELAQSLGAGTSFDELRVLVAQNAEDPVAIEAVAQTLGAWIRDSQLAAVHEVRVPPPGQHPHQTQMTSVLVLLLLFSLFVFVMSSLLAGSMLAALLARQVREIGVMKTLGATSAELTRWYTLVMLTFAGAAFGLAWLPGTLGARAWATAVARLLNFDLKEASWVSWVTGVTLVTVLSLPVLVALPTIRRATHGRVYAALSDFGLGASGGFLSAKVRGLFRYVAERQVWLAYAVRNTRRQRQRSMLSVALLAVSGGVTIAAFSMADAWQAWTERLHHEQAYDLEVALVNSTGLAEARAHAASSPGVSTVEAWGAVATSIVGDGEFPVRTTYPDDAHGAFALMAPPLDSKMLRVETKEGRWLSSADSDELVLNQMVPGQRQIPVGARVRLSIEGKTHEFTVVGKLEQVGVGAIAYTHPATLAGKLSPSEIGGLLRMQVIPGQSPSQANALVAALEERLVRNGARVLAVTPREIYTNAMVAHFEILIRALLALAALTASVGALGLSSSAAVNVLERTRELGVLRAIGANGAQLRNIVLAEGVLVGASSWVFSLVLGWLLALGLGAVIGRMSFALPLPLTFSHAAAGVWGVAALVLSGIAGVLPASRAARVTVREAVGQV